MLLPIIIPRIMRFLDVSNMGILDPDGSSSSDPGISGNVNPSVRIYGNGFLGDYQEPVTWGDEYDKLFEAYKRQRNLIDVFKFKKDVLGIMSCDQVSEHMAEEGLEVIRGIANVLTPEEEFTNELPLEGSGRINYVSG